MSWAKVGSRAPRALAAPRDRRHLRCTATKAKIPSKTSAAKRSTRPSQTMHRVQRQYGERQYSSNRCGQRYGNHGCISAPSRTTVPAWHWPPVLGSRNRLNPPHTPEVEAQDRFERRLSGGLRMLLDHWRFSNSTGYDGVEPEPPRARPPARRRSGCLALLSGSPSTAAKWGRGWRPTDQASGERRHAPSGAITAAGGGVEAWYVIGWRSVAINATAMAPAQRVGSTAGAHRGPDLSINPGDQLRTTDKT